MIRIRVMRFLLAVVLLQSTVSAQPAPIRVDVRLVNISASVRDAQGKLEPDLGADDFEVFEDGAPQKISFFARSADLPLALGLLVDASDSQERFLKKHAADLKIFLETVLQPKDRAFLLCFGNHLRMVTDFTSSGGEIISGLERFQHGARSFPEIGPPDLREAGTAFYDSIYYSVAQKLAGAERGRRALVIFSDGEDNSSAHNMMETLETAQSADVLLFGVRYTSSVHGRLTARNKYGMSVMARLARDTGAADFDAGAGDLREHFAEISYQLRSSCELGYYSTNPANDGSFRKVEIRPKRSDLVVGAKTGYFARGGVAGN